MANGFLDTAFALTTGLVAALAGFGLATTTVFVVFFSGALYAVAFLGKGFADAVSRAKLRPFTAVEAEVRREVGALMVRFPPLAMVTLMRDSRLSKKLSNQGP
ncbi:MAG: hypothetical protein ABIP75_18560 [Pyrinomonadaceae bacterium]